MTAYTVTTTASEEEALLWAAAQADPPQTAAEYLDARVHEVLHAYEVQHAVETAVSTPQDVAAAYVKADTATQQQVDSILGITPTP